MSSAPHMTETNGNTPFTAMQEIATLREFVRALDRRHPKPQRDGERRIAHDAQLLRHQAIARIEELQTAESASDQSEAELAAAIMTDDGAPPLEAHGGACRTRSPHDDHT